MYCASVRDSCCQSIAVRAKGGLSRGKGSAVASGLDFHWAWKTEGSDDSSIVQSRGIFWGMDKVVTWMSRVLQCRVWGLLCAVLLLQLLRW